MRLQKRPCRFCRQDIKKIRKKSTGRLKVVNATRICPLVNNMWSRLIDRKRDIIIAKRLGKAIRFSEKDIRPWAQEIAGF
jgi:DNA gyrase/topoisomerase IV subunit A